jgi:hypothetical protein
MVVALTACMPDESDTLRVIMPRPDASDGAPGADADADPDPDTGWTPGADADADPDPDTGWTPGADADADPDPVCSCNFGVACDYDCDCDPDCPCSCDTTWACTAGCGCDPECDPAYGSCEADGTCNPRCPAAAADPDCSGGGSDAGTDTGSGSDAGTGTDTGGGTCSYPGGPYEFNRVGRVVPPMAWPSAVATGDSLAADLARLHCDPSVNSIFIQVVTTACPNCPARMSEIAGLQSHWESTGAKWIFLVGDASSASAADSYLDRYGVGFGWRSNDADNSAGGFTVTGSGIYGGVPWTAVISTRDMTLRYDEPDDRFLDIAAIATELAGE